MLRYIQVTRSALKVLRAWFRNAYDWKFEVARQCKELGGVYIKFLQMLAVHNSTKHLVEDMGSDLAFEQVDYEPIDVPKELGPLFAQFSKINPEPFAAGSYGQVYMAWLPSGDQVIIKILRPSVRRLLQTDLRMLRFLSVIVGWFAQTSMVNFQMMAREFARATTAETNYLLEAQSGERLRTYFGERKTIVIPKSYFEYTSRTVLVQDYVAGVSVASVTAKQREGQKIDELVRRATGSDIWAQLELLGTELLRATLYADYIMIDPHPGNIRLLPNNQVALIDFGLIAKAPTNRDAFASLIHEFRKLYEDNFDVGGFAVAMLAFFDVELHDALTVMAREQTGDYSFSLQKFVEKTVKTQSQQARMKRYLSSRQVMQLFVDVLNQDNKLGLRLTEENALLQRSMTMFMSMVRGISDAHTEPVYASIVRAGMVAIDDEVMEKGIMQSSAHREMSEEKAIEVTANWLSVVAERDRALYRFITKRSFA